MFLNQNFKEKLKKLSKELDIKLKKLNDEIYLYENKIQTSYNQYLHTKKVSEEKLKYLRNEYKNLLKVKNKLEEEVLNVL